MLKIMKKCVIIVDNSNVWIEGKKFSAKQKGIKAENDAEDAEDPSWRIDFGKLLSTIADGKEISHAILVGSEPPQNDSLWDAAKKQGFEVKVHARNYIGKEKAVDTEIVMRGTRIICCSEQPGVLKLLSGDRDFLPLVECATEEGWDTVMWAFTNAFNEYGEMAQAVNTIKPLDDVFDLIGRYEFKWPINKSPLGTLPSK